MKKTLLVVMLLSIILTACCNTRNTCCTCNCRCCCVEQNAPAATEIEDENQSVFTTENEEVQSYSSEEYSLNAGVELQLSTEEKEEEEIYCKAKQLYLSGEWDGLPKELEGHTVEFSPRGGDLLVDGYIVKSGDLHLPSEFDFDNIDSNLEYIPGAGEYAIKDGWLVRYVRGEEFKVGDSKLNCKGLNAKILDTQFDDYDFDDQDYTNMYYHETPYLYYDEVSNKLIFVTIDSFSNNQYIYNLYIFSDYNTGEIKYIDKMSTFSVIYDGKRDIFYYTDLDGNDWEYTKAGPKRFVRGN